MCFAWVGDCCVTKGVSQQPSGAGATATGGGQPPAIVQSQCTTGQRPVEATNGGELY